MGRFVLGLLCGAGSRLAAQGDLPAVSETLGTVSVTNYTGFVMDAPPATPGLRGGLRLIRAGLPIGIRFNRPGVSAATYRLGFSLLDDEDQPVALGNADDPAPGNTFTTLEVNASFQRPASGNVSSNWLVASLRPATRLDQNRRYRVRVQSAFKAGETYEPRSGTIEPAGAQYFHFSDAPPSDPPVHALGSVQRLDIRPGFSNNPDSAEAPGGVLLSLEAALARFDETTSPPHEDSVSWRVRIEVADLGTGAILPLKESDWVRRIPMLSHQSSGLPSIATQRWNFPLVPEGGATFDPRSIYRARVSLSHDDPDGSEQVDSLRTLDSLRLIQLSGRLFFGDENDPGRIETRFDSLLNDPAADWSDAGGVSRTRLVLPLLGAWLARRPDYRFGDPIRPIEVRLTADGDAYLRTDGVTLEWPVTPPSSPDSEPVQGIHVSREGITLSALGAHATALTVRLPRGFGVSPGARSRVLLGSLRTIDVLLDDRLRPRTDRPLSPGPELYAVLESFPIRWKSRGMMWRVVEGVLDLGTCTADFVEGPTLDRMEALSQNPAIEIEPAAIRRPSNRHVFRSIIGTGTSPLRVRAGSDGEALADVEMLLAPGHFEPHFPLGWRMSWLGAGVAHLHSGVLAPSEGGIDGGEAVAAAYRRRCPDGDCGGNATPALAVFRPDGGRWAWTRDGGLRADGLVDPHSLQWGAIDADRMAHEVGSVTAAALLLGGGATDLRDRNRLGPDDGPGDLLLSGHGRPADPGYVERPGMSTYDADGASDYPGLNVRVPVGSPLRGRSRLAGQDSGTYPLSTHAKLYARPGGVSGVLDGTAPPGPLVLYGFDTRLNPVSWSFLDSRNIESRTTGRLAVPFPAGFEVDFERLALGCRGQLTEARLGGTTGELGMEYWETTFLPQLLQFRHPVAAGCSSVEQGALAIGARLQLPLTGKPVHGVLGFIRRTAPDGTALGDLTSPSDGIGVDSTIDVPLDLPVEGPGGTRYRFHPVSPAYFNRYAAVPADPGFLNLAGRLEIPFFESMKVHVHAIPGLGEAGLYLMGGWNVSNGPEDPARAWVEGSRTYFNSTAFDPEHRGYPVGVTLDGYRSGPGVAYRPRAHQTWLDVVDFDLPARWLGGVRKAFGPASDSTVDLKIVSLPSRLAALSPTEARIELGAEIPRLPRFSTEQLLGDFLDQRTGVFRALADGLQDVGKATGLAQAADRLDDLLGTRLDSVFESPFRSASDDLVGRLHRACVDAYADGSKPAAQFHADVCAAAGTVLTGDIEPTLNRFLGSVAAGQGLLSELDGRLRRMREGAVTLHQIVSADPSGRHPVLSRIAEKLALQAEAGTLVSQLTGPSIDAAVEQLGPALDELSRALLELIGALQEAETAVGPGGELASALNGILTSKLRVDELRNRMRDAVCASLASLDPSPGRLLAEFPEPALRARIRRSLLDEFSRSFVPDRFGFLFRAFFGETRGLFRLALDDAFARINEALRNGILQQLGPAALPGDLTRGLGVLSSSFQGSQLHGHARWNGSAISEARVDGRLGLILEDPSRPLGFEGHILVSSHRVDRPLASCRAPAAKAVTIQITASASPVAGVQGAGPSGKGTPGADVDIAAALEPGTWRPLGVDGTVGLRGSVDAADLRLDDPKLLFSAGDGGHYLAGKSAGLLNGISATINVFVGTICDLARLDLLDQASAAILALDDYKSARRPGGGMAGYYFSADGEFPLEKILGLPSTCALSVLGAGGNAYFGFLVDRPGLAGPAILAGRRLRHGLHGRLLCAVDVVGTLDVGGAVGLVPTGSDLFGWFPIFDPKVHLSGAGHLGIKTPLGTKSVRLDVLGTFILGPPLPVTGYIPVRDVCYEVRIEDLVSLKGCTRP